MVYIINKRSKANPSLVGSKAWSLFRLQSSFSVPHFVVLSTRAYRDFRRGESIACIKDEAARALARFLKKGKVAIRSSGTAEDLPGVSFAGMYSTSLNITNTNDGMQAIVGVWDSVDSPRVIEYLKKMSVPAGDMAVIIQRQLDPKLSGVMVTQSPFSISEVLIECCEGLGDKLVSGRITPTRYRIRNQRIVEQRGKNILSERQLLDLVKTGKRIERFFKSPQDVEWAIQDGRLYILQSRPVFVYATASRKKGMVWCNANVRETIPDPISPMTWSMFDTSFFPGIMVDVFGFPISEERYRKFRPVEMLSGRLYWNINNTLAYGQAIGPLLDFMGGDRAVDPQMAVAFEAVDINDLPEILPASRMFIFSARALARLVYYLSLGFVRYGWMSRKIARANDELESYCEDFTPSEDLAVAIYKVKIWMKVVLKRFARRYFGGILLGAFYFTLLNGLLSIRMGKKGEALARKTIIGIIDKTGEMAININRLASLARKKLKVLKVMYLRRLYKQDREFQASIDKFMNDFGHRGPAEFDVASLNWREDHDMLYRVIMAARDSHEYAVDRASVVKTMLASARPFERVILKAFLPRLEVLIPLRENGKHFYLKATARTKDQLLVIGECLAKRRYIERPRDVFFLTLRDLEGIKDARHTKKEVVEIINQRKKQWHEYRRVEVPDIIYESGERVRPKVQAAKVLRGEPLSSGRVKARARIIADFSQIHRLKQDEILVTHHADPGWTPLFTVASGLIIEVGGVICHAAMVARELGIPALSITGATSLIRDGSVIELDADMGKVVLP